MNITDCATQWKPLVTETAIKKEIEKAIDNTNIKMVIDQQELDKMEK